MPAESAAATVRSRYMQQAASDLEENHRQQQELALQIEALREEEKLLLDILSLAEQSTAVPEQARGPAEQPGAPERPQPSATSSAHPVKALPKKTPARKGGRGAKQRPPLGDLLIGLLKEHKGPRLAKELRDELVVKHPDRAPTPQVVRNTMEGLVAKGLVERHKQERSVMYAPITVRHGSASAATDHTT